MATPRENSQHEQIKAVRPLERINPLKLIAQHHIMTHGISPTIASAKKKTASKATQIVSPGYGDKDPK